MDLPEGPMPTKYPDNYTYKTNRATLQQTLYTYSNSDWAYDP